MTVESPGFSRTVAPVWVFSRGTKGNSGSLSCCAREVRSPFELQWDARHCSRVMVGDQASRRVEEGISRYFSICSRRPWVPSTCAGDLRELLKVPMKSQGYCGVGWGLLGTLDQEGRTDSVKVLPGTSVFLSSESGMSGNFLGCI